MSEIKKIWVSFLYINVICSIKFLLDQPEKRNGRTSGEKEIKFIIMTNAINLRKTNTQFGRLSLPAMALN